MKYMAEIELNSGMRNRLMNTSDITRAKEETDKYIAKQLKDHAQFKTVYEASKYLPFKPTGKYTIRPATAKEEIEDLLKDFAGNWNEYNLSGLAEEIIEIVLEEQKSNEVI
jgi:hypothetical protein